MYEKLKYQNKKKYVSFIQMFLFLRGVLKIKYPILGVKNWNDPKTIRAIFNSKCFFDKIEICGFGQ